MDSKTINYFINAVLFSIYFRFCCVEVVDKNGKRFGEEGYLTVSFNAWRTYFNCCSVIDCVMKRFKSNKLYLEDWFKGIPRTPHVR